MSEPISAADPGDFEATGPMSGDASNGGASSLSSAASSSDASEETNQAEGAYWRENIRLLVTLMTIWFAVSFGCGILFRGFLDQFSLGGYPLGFWFAQQGSIYVFIALIVFYVVRMKQIERKYDLDD